MTKSLACWSISQTGSTRSHPFTSAEDELWPGASNECFCTKLMLWAAHPSHAWRPKATSIEGALSVTKVRLFPDRPNSSRTFAQSSRWCFGLRFSCLRYARKSGSVLHVLWGHSEVWSLRALVFPMVTRDSNSIDCSQFFDDRGLEWLVLSGHVSRQCFVGGENIGRVDGAKICPDME